MTTLDQALGIEVRWAEPTPWEPRLTDSRPDGELVFERRTVSDAVWLEVFRRSHDYLVREASGVSCEIGLDGRSITIRADANIDDLELNDFLVSSVLPLISQLQDRPALHASAVAFDAKAIGFVGRSGAGKSTMAAIMVGAGALLVSDDCLVLQHLDGQTVAVPSASGVRLRSEGGGLLALTAGRACADGKSSYRLEATAAPLPIQHLMVLGAAADRVGLEPLRPRDAALALAENLFRLDPRDPKLLGRELDFLEQLTNSVSVSRLRYPRRGEVKGELVEVVRGALERSS